MAGTRGSTMCRAIFSADASSLSLSLSLSLSPLRSVGMMLAVAVEDCTLHHITSLPLSKRRAAAA